MQLPLYLEHRIGVKSNSFMIGFLTVVTLVWAAQMVHAGVEESDDPVTVEIRTEKKSVLIDEEFELIFKIRNVSERDILVTYGKDPILSSDPKGNALGFNLFFFPNDHLAVYPMTKEIKAQSESEFSMKVSMNLWSHVKSGEWELGTTIGYVFKEEFLSWTSVSDNEKRQRAPYRRIGEKTPKRWIMGSDFKELQRLAYTDKDLQIRVKRSE